MKSIEIILVAFYSCACLFYLPRLITKKDLKSLKILTLFFVTQNFICILASDVFPTIVTQFLILYKEIVLYGAVVISVFFSQKGKINRLFLPVILAAFVFSFYMFVGNASVFTKLVSLRQLLTPFILLLYGSTVKLSQKDFESYIRFFISLCLALAIFGLVERFVLGDTMWKLFHIEKYMGNKGFSKWVYNTGLPGNFYSADLYSLLGFSMRRLVGLAADPLLTGHFLAIGVVILLFSRIYPSTKQITILFVLTVASVLTLSKGVILVIIIAYMYKIWKRNKALLLVFIPVALYALYIIISRNIFDTVSRHVAGLTSSFSLEFIIGGGIGTSGNYATLYGGNSSTSGESYVGLIIGQIGFIGLMVCVAVFVKWGSALLRLNKHPLAYSIFAYVIAVLIESLVSESAINFVGSGFAFILFGILSSNKLEDIKIAEMSCIEIDVT